MKKTLLIAIIGLIALSINAQNFSAEVLDTTLYAQPSIYTFEGSVDLYNHTFGDLNMAFENIEQVVPAGWETSNCLGANCLPIGVTSGSFVMPVVSSDNYVIGHFYPNNVPGTGYMRIKLYEQFNPNNFIILTYYGVAGQVTDVYKLEEKQVQVFPNPTANTLNIALPNDQEQNVPIQIIDALGKVVRTIQANQSLNQIDVADLQSGIYVVSIGNVNKKFIKE